MKLYVISGAAGMTGSELVKQIIEQGDAIIGFDNFFASSIETVKNYLQSPLFHFYEYDLNNFVHMKHIEEEIRNRKKEFTSIVYINCAAVVHTEHFYHVENTFTTNVLGMKSFLEQAISVGSKAFINCSTSEVYSMNSWNENGGIAESDYLLLANAEHSQRTSYATGKLLTEFFMKDAIINGRIQGCSIRFANVYSKNELLPKHIIPYVINSLIDNNGTVVLLENSKKNKRTFLHNIDSCAAVLSLIETPLALDGSVYNVATDEEISILDLVKQCAQKLGIENYKIDFDGYRASDPERRLLSTKKIRSRTNWKPQISLSQGLDMIISFRNAIGKG